MGRRPPARWIYQLAIDQPGTSHEVILQELRAAMLSGLVPPGAPISPDDVADRFQVSRIPVREALKTLIGEGLVEHEPRAGYKVAQLTRAELGELYIVREALENAALAAAVRTATPTDDLAVLESYEILGRAVEDDDRDGHQRESRNFHFALAAPCRMPRLLGMLEAAWNVTEPLQPMTSVSHDTGETLHGDHKTMVDAFVARDAETLLAASAVHYRRLHDVLATLPTRRMKV